MVTLWLHRREVPGGVKHVTSKIKFFGQSLGKHQISGIISNLGTWHVDVL